MIKLRQFQSADLNALYAVLLATGHEGGDASHFYEEAKLMGHIYSAPYALFEPALVLVVDGDEVAGFAAGAIDTCCGRTFSNKTGGRRSAADILILKRRHSPAGPPTSAGPLRSITRNAPRTTWWMPIRPISI
jgi:hypothetical protein